ncbi:MAG: flagellar filament capping protein FliD [Lachnospiraceae bacterium]
MAGVRMTGLASGLDTESLVGELSKAYQTKVDNAKKKQTKAEWKKEAWASLNTKLMNFYKGALSTFKSTTTYNTKAVKGTLSGVSIKANSKAVNGNHTVKVNSTASAQMWTGYQLNNKKITSTSYGAATDGSKKISELTDAKGYKIQNALDGSSFKVSGNGVDKDINISINENTTVDDMLTDINSQLSGTGLTASFEKGALKFSNTSVGADGTPGYDISLVANDETSASALGLSTEKTTIKPLGEGNSNNTYAGKVFAYEEQKTSDSSVTGNTKLMDLGIAEGTIIKVNGQEIAVDRTTTLSGLASSMAKTGINASYDATQGRFYLSSKNTGTANAFTVEADDDTLTALGLKFADDYKGKIDARDASVTYNGVEYKQATNTFEINGLTIEASGESTEQTFTVDNDVDGIYDKVKNFVKEYNELIAEMSKLYNADAARGYEPLTSEEKEALTEEDAKNYEDKIKSSLLRRDDTIGSLLSNMRTILNKSVEVTNADGTTSRYALSSFGIVTGDYRENGKLHINGDSDDADYMDLDDKLKSMIANNPNAVTKTLTSLGNEMYSYLMKAQGKTETSSSMTFYNDITLDKDIKDYKQGVSDLQEKLQADEDKYYKQFSAMETAMAKLQSQQTYISQLFGGM